MTITPAPAELVPPPAPDPGRPGWRDRLRSEEGFSLIEMVAAMVIFAIVAVGLAGMLESSIAANGLARQKTVAHQLAQDQVEYIRTLDYTSEVGIVGGNPNGIVQATRAISVRGVQATMTTTISWVNDPTPASYQSYANYKRIRVVITSNRNGRVLTSVATYMAPPGRAPFGGINNAILNVTVQEMGPTNAPLEGALVSLANGPSAPLSDTTSVTGLVTFPALTANPTTGPDAYYDVTATKAGFLTYVDDRTPLAPAHRQLAPSQTDSTTIRLYRPATINVAVRNGGTPYAGTATVKVSSDRTGTTQSYSVTGGSLPITTFAGNPVVPGDFAVRAYTSTGLCADPVARYVPDDYPTVMSSSYSLDLATCPMGNLRVTVNQLGGVQQGATVVVSGGPNDFAAITQTTNASGQTTFTNLPSGSDAYTIQVTDKAGNVTQTVTSTVSTGTTTDAIVNLADPPMGSISALVQWLGADVSGATVVVSGGPYGISRTLTTGGSGTAVFSNVIPAGTGYTITASKNGQSATATSVSVTSGSTTSRTLALPTGSIAVTATWAGIAAGSATVTISGGPNGGTYTGTTNASGQVTVTVPATTSSYPYTVTVAKNGGTGSATVSSLASGATQAAAVAMGGVGTLVVTSTWAGQPAGNQGGTNTITVSGGPNGNTLTGTTDASGQVTFTVPATTSSYPFTVSGSKNGGTGSQSVATVLNGATTSTTVALTPTKTLTLTIRAGGSNIPNQPVTVSLTDGPNGDANAAPAYTYVGNTNSSSRVVLTVPVQSTGTYTVKVYRTGCPGTTNRSRTQTVNAASGTTSATINMTTATCPVTLP